MVVLATSECDNFEVDDSFERLDLDKLHATLSTQYWNAGATREKVEACARGSWIFGLYGGPSKGKLVGFMRLVTDRRSFYYVSDVFIDQVLQGRGLGEFLIRAALSQPGVADTGRGFLFTGDPRSPAWYTKIAGFQIINQQATVFPNGKAGTRWCMLRNAGPLLATGASVSVADTASGQGRVLGIGTSIALASAVGLLGFVVGARTGGRL
jgi:ribosomal protein S18 acetylase RimI-like enzyme